MRKKLVAAVLCVVMAAGMTACGSGGQGAGEEKPAQSDDAQAPEDDAQDADTEKTRENLKIGVSWKTLQEERWVRELDEIEKVCEEQGIEMLYQCSENDSQKQVGQIENLISQGVDMLIVMAPEKGAMDNVLKDAHEAGVFVCYYEQVGGETYFDMSAGNDYFEVGQAITKTIADMNISGDVCYLLGDSAGGSGVINFRDGMQDSMKNCEINVVGEQFVTNWDPATGMGYVENWLTDYKDTLSAVLCMNDGLAGGAVQARPMKGWTVRCLSAGRTVIWKRVRESWRARRYPQSARAARITQENLWRRRFSFISGKSRRMILR